MEPIISSISEAVVSSKNMDIATSPLDVATSTLKVQEKQRGKGPGKKKRVADASAFFWMLKQNMLEVSQGSSKGKTNNFVPVSEDAISTGDISGKIGNKRITIFPEGGVPVDGANPVNGSGRINIRSLLKGLGLSDGETEEISKEIELKLFPLAVTSEKGVAKENIAAVLRGYGFTEEKIQGALAGLENSGFIPPLSMQGQEAGQGKTRNSAGGAAPNGKGADSVQNLMNVPASWNTASQKGENTADVRVSVEKESDKAIELRAAGAKGAATKQAGVNLREGLMEKEQLPMKSALPLAETIAGEVSVLMEKGAQSDGKEAAGVRIRTKQRPVLFQERIAEADIGRQERDPSLQEGAAAGNNERDPLLIESAGKRVGKEEGNVKIISLSGQNGTAIDSAAAGKIEQGNPYAISGAGKDMNQAMAPGLQPEILIDQIAGPAGQILQNGPGRIKITLNPPHLGTIDMDVLVRNNKVEVVMIASNQEVQQALKSHADQLKYALQGQGLNVDGFDVLLHGNHGGQAYRFRGGDFTGNGDGKGGGGKEDVEADSPLPGILSPQGGAGTEQGDSISLFV